MFLTYRIMRYHRETPPHESLPQHTPRTSQYANSLPCSRVRFSNLNSQTINSMSWPNEL